MNLLILRNTYSVYQFNIHSGLPDWIYSSDFYTITRSTDELSVVAIQNNFITEGVRSNRDWRIIKILGELDFSVVGIIAEISNILKDKNIPVFVISSYNTDFILVKETDLKSAIMALKEKDHIISDE